MVAWVRLLLAGALIRSTLELLSSSVLPICFVAPGSDAPAPAAIEIGASIMYRPKSPKILKFSQCVRQAGYVRDQLACRSRRLPVSIGISDVTFLQTARRQPLRAYQSVGNAFDTIC